MRNRPDPLRVTSAQLSRAQRWPIGTAVTVTQDDGSQLATHTRSAPWRVNVTWMILVDDEAPMKCRQAFALARVVERSEVL